MRTEAVVNAVCDCSDRERSAGQVRIGASKLPASDPLAEKAVRLEREVIDAAHPEIVRPVEIGEPAIRVRIRRVRGRAAAVQAIRA